MQSLDKPNRPNDENYSNVKNEISTPTKNYISMIPLIIGSGFLITIDQWTKHLVAEKIPFLGTWLPENLAHLESYFRFVHWRNSGAAFGIFSNGNTIFLIIAIIASTFIFAFYPLIEKGEWPLRFAMILQLGGALGNMIDRVRFGYVIDFISIKELPVFNIADISISCGVVILLVGVMLQEKNIQKNKEHQLYIAIPEITRKEDVK